MKMRMLKKHFPYLQPTQHIGLDACNCLIDKKCIRSWLNNHANKIIGSLQEQLLILDGKSLNVKQKFCDLKQNTLTLNVFARKLGITLTQTSIPEGALNCCIS